MVKKKEEFDYSAEIKKLKAGGPGRLYLLYGEEDYLRDRYLETLKSLCIPEGESGFNFKRIDGPGLDVSEVEKAIDQMPFLSDRTFLELRNVDINKLADADRHIAVLSSVPDYCTVCFVQDASYETDGRLKFVKFLKDKGVALQFVSQGQSKLISWIKRRFEAAGKEIDNATAQRLVFISGDLMNSLIPEIEKIAAYAKGEKVTVADVNAVANRIPESDIFDLTNAIADRRFQSASGILADLLGQRNVSVPAILSLLSNQFRRILIASEAKDTAAVMELCNLKSDYPARLLRNSARGFEKAQLQQAITLCAQADYRLKSESVDEKQLLKETVMRIALSCGETRPENLR